MTNCSEAELTSTDIANSRRREIKRRFIEQNRNRCISGRVFQLLMPTSRVTVISGKEKSRETFCVAGGGYNRNVGREEGRRETREGGMRESERKREYLLTFSWIYITVAEEGKGGERIKRTICIRESVIDRARIQAGR